MKRRVAFRLLAIVIGLLVALGLVEGLLRAADPIATVLLGRPVYALSGPRLPLPYDEGAIDRIASGEAWAVYDAELGWVPSPNYDRVSEDGVRYRHNSEGARSDREYTTAPGPGIRRLLAYGDSFTYCQEVTLEQCWLRRLELLLPNTEALDFGVPAYGPDQALLRYEREGDAWHPCAVLIGYSTENMHRVVNRFRPFYAPEEGLFLAKPRYLFEDGRLTLLPSPARRLDDLRDPVWVEENLGPHDAWYFPNTFVPSPLDRLETLRLARTASYRASRPTSYPAYHPGTEAFDVTAELLVQFAQAVAADGATPVVVVFPWQYELRAWRDDAAKPQAPLLEALRARNVPTIDLTEALSQASQLDYYDDLFESGGHYTPQGNAVVANALADELPRLTAATCE